jgi:hypothetical protein
MARVDKRTKRRMGLTRKRQARQGAVASTVDLFRDGAVGFIDWLDGKGVLRPIDVRGEKHVEQPAEKCTGKRQNGESNVPIN